MSRKNQHNEFLWVEKYRPRKIDDCALPARIKNHAKALVAKGQITNMIFFGSHGVGKTTLAEAICEELGCTYLTLNSSKDNGIDTLRTTVTQFASTAALNGKPKVVIFDEADGLNPQSVQPALRNFIEQYSMNCRFILTCNYKDRLIPPLTESRLQQVDFSLQGEEKKEPVGQFFKRVQTILTAEGVTFDKKVVAEVITAHFPDYRRIINELQNYAIRNNNVIDIGILARSEVDVGDLFGALKAKEFKKMRSIAANLVSTYEVNAIYRKLFDSLPTQCEPRSQPAMILLVADYSYKAAFVADQEINLVACLIEMMASGEWQ